MRLVDGKSDDLVKRINHYSLINPQCSSETASVSQPKHPLLRSIHRALCEPFERCTEQYQMVLFPHCVVGRASESDEYVARLRVHGCAFGRKRGGRRGGSHPVVCGRQQYQLLNLVRMLRGIASGAWPAERPRNQTYAVYMAQSPYIIDRGADVVPVGRDRRHLPRIARSARCRDEARNEGRLLLPGEITGIVH